MKNIVRNLFLSALLTLATGAFAEAPAPGTGPGAWDPAQRQLHMLKGLGLTDTQSAQVLDLFSKAKIESRSFRAQVKVLNAQIEAALTTTSPDVKAINALVDQKAKIQADAQKARIGAEVQIHQLVGDKIFYELKDRFLAMKRFHLGVDRRWIPQGPGASGHPGDKPSQPAPEVPNP